MQQQNNTQGAGRTEYNMVMESSVVCAVTWRFVTLGTEVASAVSSWKCVANKHRQFTFTARCSEMAHAKPGWHTHGPSGCTRFKQPQTE